MCARASSFDGRTAEARARVPPPLKWTHPAALHSPAPLFSGAPGKAAPRIWSALEAFPDRTCWTRCSE